MTDILDHLDHLRRPRLLIRAARIGAEDYRRDSHLPRLLGHGELPHSMVALARLMSSEAALEDCRRVEDTSYSVIRHLDLMIAMIGEARIIRAAHPALVRPRTAAPAPALVAVD